jgi:adenosylhomocysteine nucleosidase
LKTVVIVSANGEWSAVRALMPTASEMEQGAWESLEAEIEGRAVIFVHGGWGKVSAAASAQFVIDRMRPDIIVNLGTCGGLQGRIELGTVILADRTAIYDIIEQMTDAEAATAYYSTELDLSWLPRVLPMPATRGLLVSADRDILAADLPQLVRKFDAVAADWESGAIAWVAKRNSQRLLILRGVSDLVGSEGGEAYGDYGLFLRRTSEVMKRLLDALPKWLEVVEPAIQGSAGPNPS